PTHPHHLHPSPTRRSSDLDRRRYRAARAHRGLRRESDSHTLAGREAVCDERRLERDHATVVLERLLDLRRYADHGIAPNGIAPTCAQHRAAASSPSAGPPMRKPAARASPAPVVSTTSVSSASKSSPSTDRPRAPRFTTQRAASAGTASCSRSVATTRSGAS